MFLSSTPPPHPSPCTLETFFVELLVLIDLKIFVYELHFPNGAKRKMFLYLSGELVIEY